jgi:hypothetical protein
MAAQADYRRPPLPPLIAKTFPRPVAGAPLTSVPFELSVAALRAEDSE